MSYWSTKKVLSVSNSRFRSKLIKFSSRKIICSQIHKIWSLWRLRVLPLMTLTKTLADFAIVGTPAKITQEEKSQFRKVLKGWKHHYMYNFRYLIAPHAEFVICRKETKEKRRKKRYKSHVEFIDFPIERTNVEEVILGWEEIKKTLPRR